MNLDKLSPLFGHQLCILVAENCALLIAVFCALLVTDYTSYEDDRFNNHQPFLKSMTSIKNGKAMKGVYSRTPEGRGREKFTCAVLPPCRSPDDEDYAKAFNNSANITWYKAGNQSKFSSNFSAYYAFGLICYAYSILVVPGKLSCGTGTMSY